MRSAEHLLEAQGQLREKLSALLWRTHTFDGQAKLNLRQALCRLRPPSDDISQIEPWSVRQP